MKQNIKILLTVMIIFLAQLILIQSVNAILSCSVTNNCLGTPIFKISALTNAHAENWSMGNYQYSVCCQGDGITLGHSCDTGVQVIRLSADTNAEAEKIQYTPPTYQKTVCISAPANVPLACITTTQTCASIGYDTCLATISGDTNAHVADCVTDPYQTKICCRTTCTAVTETSCTDGIDNDCDGLIDCADPDCAGTLNGTIKNQDNQALAYAQVDAQQGLTTVKSIKADKNGAYLGNVNCGTYNLVASRPDYLPKTKTNIVIPIKQTVTANFTLILGTSCEQDCTYASDNIVHAACDGKNGCAFYDSVAKAACDNSQPGWFRDYDSTHYVECASGSPQLTTKTEANVTCESGTLVKITRIVLYNGKPVKLIVAACG